MSNLPFSNEYISRCLENSREGFTLAETLMTLTVIGIVASMTIPGLLSDIKDSQFKTAAKKAESIIANGYKMMMANEESTSLSDLPLLECDDDFTCLSSAHKKAFKIANEQSKDHNGLATSYTKSDNSDQSDFSWDNVPYIFTTSDGMNMGYIQDDDSETFSIVVDTNGAKSPNKVDKDILKFRVNSDGTVTKVSDELDTMIYCNLENYTECSYDKLTKIYDSMKAFPDSVVHCGNFQKDGTCYEMFPNNGETYHVYKLQKSDCDMYCR